MGFEIELAAPPGASRRDFAERVAKRCDGTVRRYFHPQSEPSKVPGQPLFENLTLGFHVHAPDGTWIASFVDDLTLQRDMARDTEPLPGWYRIIADDGRILRLVMKHCDASADQKTVLDPLAKLFGTEPQPHENHMVRIVDDRDVSVAISAPLPGERERPCELVTAPIDRDHGQILEDFLADARALGFSVPVEGATHIHFDAAALCSAPTIARLVALFELYGEDLRQLVGVNPHCIRLGPWPAELMRLVQSEDFLSSDWPDAQAKLAELSLTKYCDINLSNIVKGSAEKHTLEIRILPSSLDAEPIMMAAALFEALLEWCCATDADKWLPESMSALIERMALTAPVLAYWSEKLKAV